MDQTVLNEWKFIRQNTTEWIKVLGDDGLKQPLLRPGLKTFGMHFEEMIEVQKAYIASLTTGIVSFSNYGNNDSFLGMTSSNELLTKMNELDHQLEEQVLSTPNTFEIDLAGMKYSVNGIISALIAHETFHNGQLVGFAYSQGYSIPLFIKKCWALS